MRKIILAAIVATMALPGTALAHDGGNADRTAAKAACMTEQTTIGVAAFNAKYAANANADNAFSNCVRQARAKIRADRLAAATTACTAMQADPNFAAAHNGMTFAQVFRRGHDPLTRCVKETVKAAEKAGKASLKATRKCAHQVADMNDGVNEANDDDNGPNHDLNDDHGNGGPNHQ